MKAVLISTLVMILSICLNLSCGSRADDKDQVISAPFISSENSGALFTTLEKDGEYYSLYFYDFSSGQIHLIHSGKSRDPAVFPAAKIGEFWLFERHQDNQVYYKGVMESGGKAILSQIDSGIFSINTPGDPIDIEYVGDQSVLAMPNLGAVILANNELESQESLLSKTSVSYSDLLLPVDVIAKSDNSFYILNQGYSPSKMKLNNQQSIIEISISNDNELTVNNDIKLTLPVPLAAGVQSPLLNILSMCPSNIDEDFCKSGVEIYDTETNQTSKVLELDTEESGYSGRSIATESNLFFAQVKKFSENGIHKIAKISFNSDSASFINLRSLETDAIVAQIFDQDSQTLMFGDLANYNGSGLLVFYSANEDKVFETIEIADIPYQGVIMR